MPHVLLHFAVEDYDTWKPVFESRDDLRRSRGSVGYQIFQSADDANAVTVILEWDTLENAYAFTESNELREAMREAGVVGRPEFYFLIEDLS